MRDWREYVGRHLRGLRLSPARELEVIAELALQFEQAYQAALAGGASEEEAVRRAELQVPDWDKLAHEINAAAVPEPVQRFSGIGGDLRYAFRFFRRSPAFTAIAVCTLAFGIGGNTAIFTLVDAVALRSMPYRDAGRLVAIETRKPQQPEVEPWTSAPDFFDIRDHAGSFSAVAGISPIWNTILTGRGPAEQVDTLFVSATFFPMLGVSAARGRTFDPREDPGDKPSQVVVISDQFSRRHFGGTDPIGALLQLGGAAYTIVGVLPAGFRYLGEPVAGTATDIDLWMPLSDNPLVRTPRTLRFLKVAGRLKEGVTVEQARDEMARFGSALAQQYPAANRGFAMSVQPLSSQVTGRFRAAGWLLLSTVGFVLLMACANVANLLLARAASRGREISVRIALGASRWRLLRQLLTEGLVLAAAGGALGLAVAYAAVGVIVRTGPEALVRTREIHIDTRALIATITAVVLSAILAGLPPALRMLRADIQRSLGESGRALTSGAHRTRSALVVAQVSVALILLVGAGLLMRSFARLLEIDPGFNARNVVTAATLLPTSAQKPEERAALYRRIRDELRSVPGVVDAAAVSRLPLMGKNIGIWLYPEGRVEPGKPGIDVEYRIASPNYFATMGIPLRAGRLFDEHDDANPGAVMVVNQTAARRIWPGQDPIGKRVKLGTDPDHAPWITVVGVIGDVRHAGIDVDPLPELYRPYAFNPLFGPILVIRTAGDPAVLQAEVAAKVRAVSSEIPAYNIYGMQALVDRSTAQRRFVMLLLGGFSVLALVLATVGIYGTVSQAVAQRTTEIGLRMALGASPAAAMRLVLGLGWRLIAAGMAIGTLAALGLTQLMRRLLFEVQPLDAPAFGAAVLVLAAFAFLACYVPARRATRVDPLEALRRDG
jgi:predicted permease